MSKEVAGDQWTQRSCNKPEDIYKSLNKHILFEQNAILYATQSYSES